MSFDSTKLPLGLYRIYWNDGGHSLAAVGQTYNGTRWLAPCNWTTGQNKPFEATTDWSVVKRVEVIEKLGTKDDWTKFRYERDDDYTISAQHPILGKQRKKAIGLDAADRIATAFISAGFKDVKIAAR